MTEEHFRNALLAIAAVIFPIALVYRLRSATSEKLDRWQEGAFILFGLRLSALIWFAGGMAWLIRPQWMSWSSLPLPAWLRMLGLGLVLLWGLLLIWTFRHLGANLTDTVVTRKEHRLVTSGPYRFVRHPFYLAFFIALLGGSLVTANWFIFVSGWLPMAFVIARTQIEESKLVERFGEEYRAYMSRTGRFVPRWRASFRGREL